MGHTLAAHSPGAGKFIWSFHMPLFFLLAGWTYNRTKYTSPMILLTRKAQALLWPYITGTIISLLVYSCTTGQNYFDGFALQIRRVSSGHDISIVLWFLRCLFLSYLLLFLILRVPTAWAQWSIALFLALLSLAWNQWGCWKVPFLNALTALPYMLLGIFWRDRHSHWRGMTSAVSLWIIALAFLVQAALSSCLVDRHFDMKYNNWGTPFFLTYPLTYSGIILVVLLSRWIDHFGWGAMKMMLGWLGRNSMPIFILHVLPSPIVRTMIGILPWRLDYLLSILLLLGAVYLTVRWCPLLFYPEQCLWKSAMTKYSSESLGGHS
jgi:acyltransferase